MSRTAGPLLKAYWQSKARDGVVPDRSAIDPSEIRGLLPDIAIVERQPDGAFRFRLAGTRIAQRCGVDPTGKVFNTEGPCQGLVELAALLHQCASEAGAVDGNIIYFGKINSFDRIDVSVMPLRRGGDAVEMFVLGLDFVVSADQSVGGNRRNTGS